MMTCNEFGEWLTSKNIYDERQTDSAREHREICKQCERLYRLDAQLELRLQEGLRNVEPPARLLARIEMNAQSVTKQDRFFAHVAWKILVPAVAIAAMFVIFLAPFAGRFHNVQEIGALAVDNHLKDLSMTFKAGGPQNVSRWFEDKLGFVIAAPDLTEQGLHLIGGRKCRLGKNDVAYLFYEQAGKRVSLFIIEPDDISFTMKQAETYSLSERGCEVKVWKEAQLLYVLVV